MTTGLIRLGDAAADPREVDTSVRTAWIWQLSFAAVVAIIIVFTALVEPVVLGIPALMAGITGVFATTIVALATPWARLPRGAIGVLPYLDIVWVGLLTFSTELRLSHLWVFPITWLAAHFSLARLAAGLGLVALVAGVEVLVNESSQAAALRVIIAVLALGFVGATIHVTARQGRAYRTLLRRQALRTQHTLDAVSDERQLVSDTLDGVHIAIARVSRSGELLSANTAYRTLYALDDLDPTRRAGSVEYDALRGDALRENQRTLARARNGERLDGEEVWLFDPEGAWHSLSVTTRPQKPRPGREPSTVIIAEDVTEIIAAGKRRDALAAVISHELRNPLTAILGHTDRLLEHDAIDGRTRAGLQVIEEASERMMHLVTSLLQSPPERAPRDELDGRAATELRAILEASVESFVESAHDHGVNLTLEAGPPLMLWADAFRVRQLVDNLVGNAVKYTPAGGRVTVSARRDGDVAEITVSDTGIGIRPEDLPHVFEHYFRSETAVDSGIPGTGLGLRIVRDIVESHDGTIELHSEPGAGTTALVRIPVEAT